MVKYCIVSVESTGFAHCGGLPVDVTLQVVSGGVIVDEYQSYVNPAGEVSAGAAEANGMTEDWLKQYGKDSYTAFTEVWQFLQKHAADFPMWTLTNEVNFQYLILQNWFVQWGYPNQLQKFLKVSGVDVSSLAGFLNDVYRIAAGPDSIPFVNPINGRPSTSLEAQASFLDIEYVNRDSSPSKSKAIAIKEIYDSHISVVSSDYKKITESKDTFTEGHHCPNCGAVAEEDPNYNYPGAMKLDCIICSESFVVQHVSND